MQFVNKSITAQELKRIIEAGESDRYVIIDLRDKHNYNQYHIEGAMNIEYQDFMRSNNYDMLLKSGNDIILYCERGGSSIYAAKRLFQYMVKTNTQFGNQEIIVNKIEIRSLSGGIAEYRLKYMNQA